MIYHPTRHDNFLWYLILRGHFSNGRNKKKTFLEKAEFGIDNATL